MKKMKNAKQFENLKFYLCQVDCEHLSHTVRFLPIYYGLLLIWSAANACSTKPNLSFLYQDVD